MGLSVSIELVLNKITFATHSGHGWRHFAIWRLIHNYEFALICSTPRGVGINSPWQDTHTWGANTWDAQWWLLSATLLMPSAFTWRLVCNYESTLIQPPLGIGINSPWLRAHTVQEVWETRWISARPTIVPCATYCRRTGQTQHAEANTWRADCRQADGLELSYEKYAPG